MSGAAARSDAGASRRGSAGKRSARVGAIMSRGEPDGSQRTRKAGGGGLGRFGTVWAGSGRSGPVGAGLGRSGPVWTGLGRFRRSRPALDRLGGPGDLGRAESVRSGPAWTGSGLGATWTGQGWVCLGGLAWSGRLGPAQAGSGRSWAIRVNRATWLSEGGGGTIPAESTQRESFTSSPHRLGFLCGDQGGARQGEARRRCRHAGGFAGQRIVEGMLERRSSW